MILSEFVTFNKQGFNSLGEVLVRPISFPFSNSPIVRRHYCETSHCRHKLQYTVYVATRLLLWLYVFSGPCSRPPQLSKLLFGKNFPGGADCFPPSRVRAGLPLAILVASAADWRIVPT